MYHKKNVDYAYLLWEDFIYQVENKNVKKSNEMYYPRFTKVIINFFMAKDQSIPRRNSVNWHYARDDYMFTMIKSGAELPKIKANGQEEQGSDIYQLFPDVRTYESNDEQISWKSSEEDDDDEFNVIQRISLTGFQLKAVGSFSTQMVLDSPCLLVLITETSQSRQHDADHAGCLILGKSTSGGIQFLGDNVSQLMFKEAGLNCNVFPSWNTWRNLQLISTEYQLLTCFTKALLKTGFSTRQQLGMRCLTPAELEVLTKESA
ncbi:hypothetical protein Tco_0490498 [Tanacetum coccineum]